MITDSSLKFISINSNIDMKTFKQYNESTLNYARTRKEIEKERKAKNISKYDKDILGKIAKLMASLEEKSLDSGGISALQKDTFISKAQSTYKNAVKQLTIFLKKNLKVKPKDVKIKLAP